MSEPGEAIIERRDDGTRRVVRADPIIRVSSEVLKDAALADDAIEPDGTLRLDSAGEYRYRFLSVESEYVHLYERIAGRTQETT